MAQTLIYFMGISAVLIYAVEVFADPEGRVKSLQRTRRGTGVGCHAQKPEIKRGIARLEISLK